MFRGVHGHGECTPPDELQSIMLCEAWCCPASLEIFSLLNTSLNSVHLNLEIIWENSYEKGGPFKILIREDTSVSMEKELRKDGKALSADAPKMICLQWTL